MSTLVCPCPGIYKQKQGVPPYRYEGCRFPLLKCCPDLSDREAEVVIVRVLNVPVPQVGTHVTYIVCLCECLYPAGVS